MFEKAELGHIERLHGIGRQLAVLKRIYQSYDLIIARVLERQKPLINAAGEPGKLKWPLLVAGEAPITSGSLASSSFGVALSAPAIVRFERLKDRINLYALGEIQDCLDEQESLVFLVSLEDSCRDRSTANITFTEFQPHYH